FPVTEPRPRLQYPRSSKALDIRGYTRILRAYAPIAAPTGGRTASSEAKSEVCNCLALRQAARVVTQFDDQHLAASGLRTTQYSVLAKLNQLGTMTLNALAAEVVMARTS